MTKLIHENRKLGRTARTDVSSWKMMVSMMDSFHREMETAEEWDFKQKQLRCSSGNKKTHLRSYSTMPGFSCMTSGTLPPCFTSGACYALRDMMYPGARENAVHNTVLILKFPEAFRESYRCNNFIGMERLHVEGDFLNRNHLAIVNEETQRPAMTYTKKYKMATDYFSEHKRNSNLHLIFSEWDGLPMYNPLNFPTCHVCKSCEEFLNLDVEQKCGSVKRNGDGTYSFERGNCSVCLAHHLVGDGKGGCFDLKDGETVAMLAH